jgi:glycolate oxidase
MSNSELTALEAVLPPGALVTDPQIVAAYRQDAARDPDAGQPAAVVRATSTSDVQQVLRWASAQRVAVVPRGAGSGLSGGASGVTGAIMLSLEPMREVSVDPSTRIAVAQAGCLNVEVKRAAAVHGLLYPPDPSSFEISTIGGNVATNAGGLCCVKYGVTADYVLGLQVVLADGTATRLGGPWLKDVAGLALARLFVGSGGILGVITEVTLRLVPAPPPPQTLVALFASVSDAANAVVAITARTKPAMLELMDHASINAVEDLTAMGLDRTARALLLVRCDAHGDAATEEILLIDAACAANHAGEIYSTSDPDEGDAFAAARRATFNALERKGDLLLEDVGVAVTLLPDLVRGVEEIAVRLGVTIAVVAHAGDGNTHPVVVYDASDADSSTRARAAFDEIMRLALRLGGTITGEHGVGRLKKQWLASQLGEEAMALTRTIKQALDPLGILNPGAVI